jgi:hypothetical protein
MVRRDKELVQIEANEDINSIRDRLTFIRGCWVLLVWPEDGTALTRKLDLVLIQREAMRRAIRLALVTHDLQVIKHARELNISTFETIGASERGRWKRGRSKVFTSRFQRPQNEPEPDELMEVASRVRGEQISLSGLQKLLIRAGMLVILAGVVLAILYVILPSATVVLTPTTQIIEDSVQIFVNPDPSITNVDVEERILPATILRVQVEALATTYTTDSQNLGSVRAIGTVVFINDTNDEVSIPLGTRVSTSTGTPIMFRTTEEVTLPAGEGQQVEAFIEAMRGSEGDVGNVAENLINTVIGPLENQVNVQNFSPTSGGQSRQAQSVALADRERLLATVSQQLYERAYTEMLARITDSQVVILETLRIDEEEQRDDWTVFSAEQGEVTETLSLSMRAMVVGMVVDTQLGQQIVFARMAKQILDGRVVMPESVQYTHGDVVFVEDQVIFTMSGQMQVVGQVDEDEIRNHLAGKSQDDAVDYLLNEVDLAEDVLPEIVLSMAWLNNQMPILPMRIEIVVETPIVAPFTERNAP